MPDEAMPREQLPRLYRTCSSKRRVDHRERNALVRL